MVETTTENFECCTFVCCSSSNVVIAGSEVKQPRLPFNHLEVCLKGNDKNHSESGNLEFQILKGWAKTIAMVPIIVRRKKMAAILVRF